MSYTLKKTYNNFDIKVYYSDYFLHKLDGLNIGIGHNFDYFFKIIDFNEIVKSINNNNKAFIDTLILNPYLIIKNIQNNNFTINRKDNNFTSKIEFTINIIEFDRKLSFDIFSDEKKQTSFKYKIEKLESELYKLQHNIHPIILEKTSPYLNLFLLCFIFTFINTILILYKLN